MGFCGQAAEDSSKKISPIHTITFKFFDGIIYFPAITLFDCDIKDRLSVLVCHFLIHGFLGCFGGLRGCLVDRFISFIDYFVGAVVRAIAIAIAAAARCDQCKYCNGRSHHLCTSCFHVAPLVVVFCCWLMFRLMFM